MFVEEVSVVLQPDNGVVGVSVEPLQQSQSLVPHVLHLTQLILTTCVCRCGYVCEYVYT